MNYLLNFFLENKILYHNHPSKSSLLLWSLIEKVSKKALIMVVDYTDFDIKKWKRSTLKKIKKISENSFAVINAEDFINILEIYCPNVLNKKIEKMIKNICNRRNDMAHNIEFHLQTEEYYVFKILNNLLVNIYCIIKNNE